MPETPATPRHDSPVRAELLVAGRYELTRRIASGGMAEVWEALDLELRRPVALKILHAHLATDRSFVTRFHAEALAIARLTHPSIVAVYDACSQANLEVIVMEYVKGRTLRDYLDEKGVLTPAEALRIGRDVSDALAVAHRAGVIHRDVKPANILLADDGRVLITDFGIAKIEDATDVTNTGTMLGSVKYLSPEQVEGAGVDPRTDIYALGVVLYEAVCGRPPFMAESPAATALARLRQDPPRPRVFRPDLATPVEALLLKCLARHPQQRFSSAAELTDAVDAARRNPAPVRQDDRPPPHDPDRTLIEARRPDHDVGRAAVDDIASIDAEPAPSAMRARTRIRTAPLMALALVVVASAVAAMLLWRARPTLEATDQAIPARQPEPTPTAPVRIVGITTFDPHGSGQPGENDDLAHLAIDGLIATSWHSESYATRDFGNLKDGVGLIIELGSRESLGHLDVRSPSQGWSGAVYAAEQSSGDLRGWGTALDSKSDVGGDVVFDLHGAEARYVLLWVTDLGDSPSPVVMRVAEMIPTR